MNSIDFAVDTVDCKSDDSSNYQINIPRMGLNIVSAELLEVILPQTSYIVRAGVNDKFDYQIAPAAPTSFTVPPGCYTAQSLLAVIAAGTTLTCTYSTDTFKVTISNGAAFTLLFDPAGPAGAKSVRALLGFDPINILSVTTTTGSNIANLYQPMSLLLRISELGLTNVLCSNGQTSTFRVPVATSGGTVLRLDRNSLYDQVIGFNNPITINQLNFSLNSNDGAVVNLNGANYQFVLRLRYSVAA